MSAPPLFSLPTILSTFTSPHPNSSPPNSSPPNSSPPNSSPPNTSHSNSSPSPTSPPLQPLKPIILLTHTRSLSTAFARIFMTHPDVTYVHEPFGDAFYFGPEKISPAFAWEGREGEEAERKRMRCVKSGCAEVRYADVVTRLEGVVRANPTKRVFIKDMAYHIITPYPDSPSSSPPSLRPTSTQDIPATNQPLSSESTTTTDSTSQSKTPSTMAPNPTVLPTAFLTQFQITILIRRPELSVPSKFKFTVPPLASTTQIEFLEREIGYHELRMMVHWLETRDAEDSRDTRDTEEGSGAGGEVAGDNGVLILDADDLMTNPVQLVRKYAELTGLPFEEGMLRWDNSTGEAKELVKKYEAYHGDVMDSNGFGSFGEVDDRREEGKKKGSGSGREDKGLEERKTEWRSKFGREGEETVRKVVERDDVDYRWLWERRLKL